MRIKRFDLFCLGIIFAESIIFLFDFFMNPGRFASFDAPFHITNVAQFANALMDGNFPVIWTDGFANYGLPIGIVAHQMTSYLGAIFSILAQDPYFGFKTVALVGVAGSALLYYAFLRIYFSPTIALAGAFLFNLASYRIFNFYVRGALPEIFSAVFLPMILIGLYFFIEKKNSKGLFLFSLSIFLLAVTHPFMLLIYGIIYAPYTLYLLSKNAGANSLLTVRSVKKVVSLSGAFAIGILSASFYLVPLSREIKYFYYGLNPSNLEPNSFFSLSSFLNFSWPYFTPTETFPRGHMVTFGILEIVGLLVGVILLVVLLRKKEKTENDGLVIFSGTIALILVFFMTPLSKIFYTYLPLLNQIQFPWRMISALIFIIPIFYCYLFSKKNSLMVLCAFIAIILLLRLPELYGKNYTYIPKSSYDKTLVNVHSVLMNTIWTGKTEEYPVKSFKGEVIEGIGKIVVRDEHISKRKYEVQADSVIRLVDNTFYFPGWKVYVDGADTLIEFQDPSYRGVITYSVPAGSHQVEVVFKDTKIRLISKILSLASLILLVGLFIMRRRIGRIIF